MAGFSIGKNAENEKIVIHIFLVPKWIFLLEIPFGDMFVDNDLCVSAISPFFGGSVLFPFLSLPV